MNYAEYAQAFDEVERDFEEAVEAFGLPFEASETQPRGERSRVAEACGCACENGGASLWRNWISPACIACRTGEQTATFFVDLRCTKHCYFCFNPNQDSYDYFLAHKRDIVSELEQAHAHGARFRHLAITGGEPMLHKQQVLAFLQRARQLFPGVHTRLYTSGDLLDEAALRELAESGLSEIRFSIKPPDVDDDQERTYELMQCAVDIIPDVVVEVPVIPGTLEVMRDLLLRCDSIGVRGVNLLEFCFPLHNAEQFRKRGFCLRKRPYDYLYDYWYGGGVPVAGSEGEALALMELATQRNLSVGVHYCSSDNKNTGQIFQQNRAFFADSDLKAHYPWMIEDAGTRFLACAKVFGEEASDVGAWLEGREASCAPDPTAPAAVSCGLGSGAPAAAVPPVLGSDALAAVPCGFDPDVSAVSFPLSAVSRVQAAFPQVTIAKSLNVVEQGEEGFRLREVAVEKLERELVAGLREGLLYV